MMPAASPRVALPRVVGHRGAAASAPENTLAGLRRAHALGAGWVEVDAKLTADGVVVLMHDDTLDRTTTGTGAVAATPAAALAGIDAGVRFAPAFAGEAVPTLEAALDLVLALGLGINVEIKPCAGREAETATATCAVIRRCWPADRPPPLLSSFAEASLAAAREAAPELPRGLLVGAPPPDWRARVKALGCATFHCSHRQLDHAAVAAVRGAGYPMLVYTVNEAERARTLYAWGVDCICSDRPEAILPVVP
ncbi:MAG: glycerophosphodiester phosphodiesterase [Alphaproteobacteria bacterium]